MIILIAGETRKCGFKLLSSTDNRTRLVPVNNVQLAKFVNEFV